MTKLQNDYWTRVESERHNKAQEQLTNRDINGKYIMDAFKVGTQVFTSALKFML